MTARQDDHFHFATQSIGALKAKNRVVSGIALCSMVSSLLSLLCAARVAEKARKPAVPLAAAQLVPTLLLTDLWSHHQQPPSPMPPPALCWRDSLRLHQSCRLFRAIVLSKRAFWDTEKPGVSRCLVPVLSLLRPPAPLRALRCSRGADSCITEIHYKFCWGRTLYFLCM